MNGRFQMQGGKNWILPKKVNANRFFWDSQWLEIWSNHFCPSIGLNGGSVATDSGDFKCMVVKTGFCRNRSIQTGSSGTLNGWKSGQTTFVPLRDRMEGAWLPRRLSRSSQPGQIFQPRQEGFYSVQGLSSPVAASRKDFSAVLTGQSLRHLPRLLV